MPSKPFATNLSDAPAYWSLGELLTMVATAEQTGGAFSLMHERLPRGAEPPPHVHSRVFCPRRIPHLLTVESDEVRMLTLCTPGGVEGLFVELGEPAGARTLPPEGDEPDVARVITLAAHYGAEVLADWPQPSGR